MGDKKAYEVLSPVSHNGKRYLPGSKIDLLLEEAQTLAKSGVIKGDSLPVVEDPAIALKAANEKIETLQKALSQATERIKLLESMTRKEETGKKGK